MTAYRKIKADFIDGQRTELNYIYKASANDMITSWNRFLDAAASRPVDGTGGSPSANVTWTRTTSSPIQGDASFLYSKLNTANTQGEGVSYDFTIPNGQQGKVQQIRFDYQIASGTFSGGTDTTDSDLIIYIYRVTATAALIEPSIFKINGAATSINYSFRGEFQTDTDATSYRLIIYSATTSTSNFTVKFDNFYVGPNKNIAGATVGPWTSFTPTGSFTNTTYTGAYRLVGDSMDLWYKLILTGTPGNATLTVNMPSGFTIDTTKADADTDNYTLGQVSILDSGTNTFPAAARYSSSTVIEVAYITSADVFASATQAAPMTFATNDEVHILINGLPLVGKSATATLGQDADTRVVVARANTAAGQSIGNAGSDKIVDFGTVVYDTHGGITTGASWNYRVPVAGFYRVKASLLFSSGGGWSAGETAQMSVYKNSVLFSYLHNNVQTATHTTFVTTIGSDILKCLAGDTLSVEIFQNSGASLTLFNDANYNYICIERMPGPSQVAAPEVIGASYKITNGTANTALTSGSTTEILDFDTKRFDTHNAVTTGASWNFKAPAAGIYSVSAQMSLAAQAAAAINNAVSLFIQKNGADDILLGTVRYETTTSVVQSAKGTELIQLVAGDTIAIRASQNTGATVNVDTGTPSECVVSINRIAGIG